MPNVVSDPAFAPRHVPSPNLYQAVERVDPPSCRVVVGRRGEGRAGVWCDGDRGVDDGGD